MNPTLPYHSSERLFRQYEPIIAAIVKSYPAVIEFNPTSLGYTHTTFVARLRNLKTSLAKNRFSPTVVDMSKFDRIGSDNIVISDPGNGIVRCGSLETLKSPDPKPIPFTVPLDSATTNDAYLLPTLSPSDRLLLCYLADKRLLKRALKITGFTDTEAKSCEEQFDVSLTRNTDNTYTLI